MGAPKSMPRPTRAQTELIETRVARGWDVPKIARVLALDPQLVQHVVDEQAKAAAERPNQ